MSETAAAGSEAPRGETAAFGKKREVGWTFTSFADDIDDAGDGVRTVQRARGAARNFDAINAIGCNRGKVKVSAELIELNAIDHDEVIVRVSAANEYGCGATSASGLAHFHVRNALQNLNDALCVPVLYLSFGDDADGRAKLRSQCARKRSGYDYLFLDCA